MSKIDFTNFVEHKTREAQSSPPIDWEARKNEWLDHLAEFYSKIEEYLSEYIHSNKIKLETAPVRLQEDYIGSYQVESKILLVGSDKVTLRPVGTLLIAANGRVDMEGPKGTVKFILTGKIRGEKNGTSAHQSEESQELAWKIATAPPQVRFIELDAENFFDALMEVVDG